MARGGIGRPIDEIALNKALFEQAGVEVIGAIINKVEADKIDMVRKYASKALTRKGIPLLGCVPLEKTLTAPNLKQIVEELGARWLNHCPIGRSERMGDHWSNGGQGSGGLFAVGVLIITRKTERILFCRSSLLKVS